jgi:CHAT domain-containing protein
LRSSSGTTWLTGTSRFSTCTSRIVHDEGLALSGSLGGTGEAQIGEGVVSLRRAFRIAGAQTVLASQWPVNDKATSQLMTEFIRRWRSGKPRAKAWREAQLSLLHSKDFANPYFWAAFTLTGQWN